MNYPAHFWDEYKTRNILSLADRVQVIREYDSYLTKPSYQSLASKFDCSSKQIKNIILNRDSIMRSFQEAADQNKNGSAGSRHDDVVQKRQEKIEFLGKVVYEYIQRALYHGYNIDNETVRQKALQIKECIAVENFQPTIAWLEDFKMTYGIPDFEVQTLRNNVPLTEQKRPHLSAIDMIQYVSRMEQEETQKKGKKNPRTIHNGTSKKRKLSPTEENLNGQHILEPTIVYETIDDDEEYEDGDVQVVKLVNSSQDQEQYQVKVPQHTARSSSPFPDIESVADAFRHLKALEEYAMLQDNFRAIGLLTQLEDVFKKQPKKK